MQSELQHFFEFNPDLLCIATSTGDFVTINESWETALGYARDEILKKNYIEFIHPGDRERTAKFVSGLKEEDGLQKLTVRFRNKYGTYRYYEWTTHFFENLIYAIGHDTTERMEAEEKLIQSNKKIQSLLSHTGDLLFVLDREYTFLEYYGATTDDLISPPSSFLGTKLMDAGFPPETMEKIRSTIERAFKAEIPTKMEYSLPLPDGHSWFSLVANPIKEQDHPDSIQTVFCVVTNITDRKKTEQQMARQKTELETIIRAIDQSSIVSITDRRGNIIKVNDKFCEISKYNREDLIGQNHRIINSGHQSKDYWKEMWATISDGKPWRDDVKNQAKDGSFYWVDTTIHPIFDETGKIRQYLSIRNLITDKKEAEEKLLESEERYTLAIEGTGAGLWDWDMIGGGVTYSPHWKSMLGYKDDEVENSFLGWRNLWHPDDVRKIEKAIGNYMEGRSDQYEVIHRLRHKNGTWRYILTRGKIVHNEKGEAIRWTGTNLDITEQKKFEEELMDYRRLMDLFFTQSLNGFFFMMLDEPIEWNDTTDKERALDYVFSHQRITRANQAILDQYGAKEEEFIGLTPGDFFAHDPEQGRSVWRDFFDAGRLHVDTEEQGFDGSKLWILGDYICIYDSRGRITGHFGIQADISDRKKAETALLNFSSMQRILMKIASEYINIPLELVNDSINNSLEEMGKFVKADRAYIFAYSPNAGTTSNEYEWCAEGINPEIEDMQNVPLDLLSDWTTPHMEGKDLQIDRVQSLPEGRLRQTMELHGIKSLITVPMMREKTCIGFVGFNWNSQYHDRTESEVQLLHLFSQMLVSIKNRIETEQELVRLAITDPLLGIYNRARLMDLLKREIHRARRYPGKSSLIMFDVDHFKKINDSFGHDTGDRILKEVSARVSDIIRTVDTFARWGGEEFMVLCTQTDLEDAKILAERIRTSINSIEFSGAGRVTVSLGVAEIDHKYNEDYILHCVDQALYLAKNNGRNCVRILSGIS